MKKTMEFSSLGDLQTAHFLGIITCQTYIYNRTVKKYIGLIDSFKKRLNMNQRF